MPKHSWSKCGFCKKKVSSVNFTRHSKSFHLICPRCYKLAPRCRHACFGAKLLTPTEWVRMSNEQNTTQELPVLGNQTIFTPAVKPNILERPLTSFVFCPIELREDCLAILTSCLAARHFLDHDLFTPAQFLLSKLQRNCLSCMSGKSGKVSLADFHSCRSYIPQLLADNCELTCHLFNVTYSERAVQFFYEFLVENSYD